MPWSWPVVAVVFFTIGFVAGSATARAFEGAPKRRLKLTIALLITGVWALSIIAGIVIDDYQTSIALHGIMGAIVGYLYKDVEDNPVTDAISGNDGPGGGSGGGG